MDASLELHVKPLGHDEQLTMTVTSVGWCAAHRDLTSAVAAARQTVRRDGGLLPGP